MARTKTQKALLKAERSGTWCAERNRRLNDHYGAISQHVRVNPSKQQKLNKVKHKERIFQDSAPFHLLFNRTSGFTRPTSVLCCIRGIVWATFQNGRGTGGGSKYSWQNRRFQTHAPAASD
ncbi:hypothetical protein D3C74_358790 [compost metagenome]